MVDRPVEDNVDGKTTELPKDALENSLPDTRVDPNHEDTLTSNQLFHYVRDEIDLKPASPLLGGNSTCKSRDHLSPGPSITKTLTKRIQLNRVRSYMDLSRADEGPSYGLPDNDSGQPEVTDLKIIQELNEEPTPDVNSTRNCPATETRKEDPGSIDISSLSLNIDPEEITVLHEIFQGKRE